MCVYNNSILVTTLRGVETLGVSLKITLIKFRVCVLMCLYKDFVRIIKRAAQPRQNKRYVFVLINFDNIVLFTN